MEDQFTITNIEPIYDFTDVSGGYFEIYFGYKKKDPFKLSFIPFLERRVKLDDKLHDYLKKTVDESKTVSDSIFDLYDIGFPVDSWVKEYIEYARDDIGANSFNAIILFLNALRSRPKDGKDDIESV